MNYRADLDGLRAVAVMSVIAYHLSPRILPGGYLGVDIFFVLSGFLITNVIWREALNEKFSIARFYERRIRRILPALLALLLVVSLAAVILLLPIDLKGYAKSVFATLGFAANIYFWMDTNYFAQGAQNKPLLHVWSLGVEEQFYIIFPLLVVFCTRWRRSAMLPITSALVLLSLLANVLAIHLSQQSTAFYLIPTRAWELGAGACLALFPLGSVANPWIRNVLGLAAAALIAGSLALKGFGLGGPVPAAVWVVLGTTLAIYLGTGSSCWLTSGLSTNVLVWVGLISYSLYLWHWPIFVFSRYYLAQEHLTPVEAGIAVALTFVLATLSWRYVERPFRNRSIPIGKVLVWVACGYAVAAVAGVTLLAGKGFPGRFSPDVERISAAIGSEYRCGVEDSIHFGNLRACPLSLPSRNPADATVVLLGNSHAQMWAPIVEDFVRGNHQLGILVPLPGCRPMPDLNDSPSCMVSAAKNVVAVDGLPKVRLVILAMTWSPVRFTPTGTVPKGQETKYLIESLDRLIAHFKQEGKTVALIGPVATPGSDTASLVARQMAFHSKVDEPLFLPESAFIAKEGEVIAHYSKRDDIVFIRPDTVQCEEGKCDYIRDGISFFADDTHVASSALPEFRPAFEPGLNQALARARP
jgi:peptidoglycan/LPS O-acetylase OafA/YrhL